MGFNGCFICSQGSLLSFFSHFDVFGMIIIDEEAWRQLAFDPAHVSRPAIAGIHAAIFIRQNTSGIRDSIICYPINGYNSPQGNRVCRFWRQIWFGDDRVRSYLSAGCWDGTISVCTWMLRDDLGSLDKPEAVFDFHFPQWGRLFSYYNVRGWRWMGHAFLWCRLCL